LGVFTSAAVGLTAAWTRLSQAVFRELPAPTPALFERGFFDDPPRSQTGHDRSNDRTARDHGVDEFEGRAVISGLFGF
jgi:hypothetical protein